MNKTNSTKIGTAEQEQPVVTEVVSEDGSERILTYTWSNKVSRQKTTMYGLRKSTITIHGRKGTVQRFMSDRLGKLWETHPALVTVIIGIVAAAITFGPFIVGMTALWNHNFGLFLAAVGFVFLLRIPAMVNAIKTRTFPKVTFGGICNYISILFVFYGVWDHNILMIVIAALTMIRLKIT